MTDTIYDVCLKTAAPVVRPQIVDLGSINEVTHDNNRQGRIRNGKDIFSEADNHTPQY